MIYEQIISSTYAHSILVLSHSSDIKTVLKHLNSFVTEVAAYCCFVECVCCLCFTCANASVLAYTASHNVTSKGASFVGFHHICHVYWLYLYLIPFLVFSCSSLALLRALLSLTRLRSAHSRSRYATIVELCMSQVLFKWPHERLFSCLRFKFKCTFFPLSLSLYRSKCAATMINISPANKYACCMHTQGGRDDAKQRINFVIFFMKYFRFVLIFRMTIQNKRRQ